MDTDTWSTMLTSGQLKAFIPAQCIGHGILDGPQGLQVLLAIRTSAYAEGFEFVQLL